MQPSAVSRAALPARARLSSLSGQHPTGSCGSPRAMKRWIKYRPTWPTSFAAAYWSCVPRSITMALLSLPTITILLSLTGTPTPTCGPATEHWWLRLLSMEAIRKFPAVSLTSATGSSPTRVSCFTSTPRMVHWHRPGTPGMLEVKSNCPSRRMKPPWYSGLCGVILTGSVILNSSSATTAA